LLRRASVTASEIIPVGKETDRRWEQGEDMSLLDFEVLEYRAGKKMAIADEGLRNQIAKQGCTCDDSRNRLESAHYRTCDAW